MDKFLGCDIKLLETSSQVELSDIISRGTVLTSADPQIADNRIAEVTIPALDAFQLKNLVDMSTI